MASETSVCNCGKRKAGCFSNRGTFLQPVGYLFFTGQLHVLIVQSSIIVRIVPAYQMMPDEEVTIVSAHQDSINQRDPRNGAAPGADDVCNTLYLNIFTGRIWNSYHYRGPPSHRR